MGFAAAVEIPAFCHQRNWDTWAFQRIVGFHGNIVRFLDDHYDIPRRVEIALGGVGEMPRNIRRRVGYFRGCMLFIPGHRNFLGFSAD